MSNIYSSIKNIVDEIKNIKKEYNNEMMKYQESLIELENTKCEMKVQINNVKKMIDLYDKPNKDTHTLFSPLKPAIKEDIILDEKKVEYNNLKESFEMIEKRQEEEEQQKAKIEEKIGFLNQIENDVNHLVIEFNQIENDNINKKIILDKSETYQKKRAMFLTNEKNTNIVKEIKTKNIAELEDNINRLDRISSYIDADVNRAKIETKQVITNMRNIQNDIQDELDNFLPVQMEKPFCEALNLYIRDMMAIYKNVKIQAKGANIIPLNDLNSLLENYLFDIIKGFTNYILIHSKPTYLNLFIDYSEQIVNMKFEVNGNFIDFSSEMKKAPKGILANAYEKLFFLHSSMGYIKNENGFLLEMKIPLKYYL